MSVQVSAPRLVGNAETVHHERYDPAHSSPFVPALWMVAGTRPVFPARVTASPSYHDHPQGPDVFDAIPVSLREQVVALFARLDLALQAAGCEPQDVLSLTRSFNDIEAVCLAAGAKLRLEIQATAAMSA